MCATTGKVAETVGFRRHLVVHLPSNERLLNETSGAEEEGVMVDVVTGRKGVMGGGEVEGSGGTGC